MPDQPPLSTAKAPGTSAQNVALAAAVASLGAAALVTQLTLMREFLGALSGNELVLGIVLGNWLLLTGLGSALGRTAARLARPVEVLVLALVVVAVLPTADVFLLRTLRNVVVPRGAAIGVMGTVGGCFVLMAPYCLALGYLLTLASHLAGLRLGPAGIGRVYVLDSLGGIFGGAAFTFLLVRWLDHFTILYAQAALGLAAAGVVSLAHGRRALAAAVAGVAAGLLAVAVLWDLDEVSASIQYAGQEVVHRGSSPYGSVVVTRTGRQYNFFENGKPLFSTGNREQIEEAVHYALGQRPDARRVLMVGGGVSGTAREVLRYGVEEVDYVEMDPAVLEIGRRFVPENLDDPRIRAIDADGRLWLRRTDRRYDVILVDVGEPSTSQINRFFTREFFEEARGRLAADGVLAIGVAEHVESLRPERAALLRTADTTLRELFPEVLAVPAGRVWFLASQGPLTADIAPAMERKGVSTRYVTCRQLKSVFAPERRAELDRALAGGGPVNTDFNPILYYDYLRLWVRQYPVPYWLVEGTLAALAFGCLLGFRPVSFAVFSAGFAGSALEVVLLVAFQALYGSLYYQVGLIVTMFMLGLAAGAFLGSEVCHCLPAAANRLLPRQPRSGQRASSVAMETVDSQGRAAPSRTAGRTDVPCGEKLARPSRTAFALLILLVAAYAAALPWVLTAFGSAARSSLHDELYRPVFSLLTLVLGGLVGAVFPVAGKADFQTVSATASRLYTADYLGAALGALVVSTLLIPLMGVTIVCLLAAGLNLAGGILLLSTSKP